MRNRGGGKWLLRATFLRPCLAQPSLTIFCVCPRAGMIRSIRSVVLNFKLDVFTQG